MIPVFDPAIGEEEIAAVTDAIRKGEISGSFGRCIPEFEEAFAAWCGCRYGVAVSNGSTALHLAVAALDLSDGDEVLVSASTNIASALAIYHHRAIPVPVDSEARTWNLDLDLLESLVTPKTRAILPVHLYGHPVDMDALLQVSRKHGLTVIEDCAESHGATCRGRMTGSFGDMACFSFYANKIITTGEGGMVVTNDAKQAERLKLLRNLAFTTPRFYHEEAGYNFRMTGYQAAMGMAQFRKIESILERKRSVAHAYNRLLEKSPHLQLPPEMPWAKNVYWMYALVLQESSPVGRDELLARLKADGIDTRTFFCPMNMQPCFAPAFARRPAPPCPVAERLWNNGFYIPSSTLLTDEQQALRDFSLPGRARAARAPFFNEQSQTRKHGRFAKL